MPSESKAVALFLFAHQDDEFGVFQSILDEIEKGNSVHCAYLTDGSYGGASPQARNQESLAVLSQLGVSPNNVSFAGSELAVRDAFMHEKLAACANWINQWLRGFANIEVIYVPAWEGGHHDHDALHALTVNITNAMNLLPRVRQFSLYNSLGCSGLFFKVFNPLTQNGTVISRDITLKNRCSFLRYCLSYPSQRKAWLGLFPFVMLHYLARGTQQLQAASLSRINEKPHAGNLYYETRKFFTWERMQDCLNNLAYPETWQDR